jgi:hypothetical protein
MAAGLMTIASGASTVQIPFNGNGWTQGASELDRFALKITITQPASMFTGVSVNVAAGATVILSAASVRAISVTASNNGSTNASANVDAINTDVFTLCWLRDATPVIDPGLAFA